MNGSKLVNDRIYLLQNLDKIILIVTGQNLDLLKIYLIHMHIQINLVLKQSIDKKSYLKNKNKNIIFVGKLNSAKGYDIFGKAIIPILNNFKDWTATVIGDEPRGKIIFNHPRLKF